MTLSYLLRLAVMSMSAFAILHAMLGTLVAVLAGRVTAVAKTLRARDGANLLFAVRLLPSVCSAFVLAALCVPSYLRFEPLVIEESVNAAGVAGALVFLMMWMGPLFRASSAAFVSWKFGRALPDGRVVTVNSTVVGVAGLLRPRLLISREVIRKLSEQELAAAIRHEEAHRAALDNWKRLLIMATPVVLPFWSAFRELDASWTTLTEWAADDDACSEARQAVDLASALVRVAGLGSSMKPVPILTTLIGDDERLSARINRLLVASPRPPRRRLTAVYLATAVVLGAGIFIPNDALLRGIHQVLEVFAQ